MALPLLPVEDVQRAFETLSEEAPVELQPFFEYFEDWWMKKVPFRLWNVSNLKHGIVGSTKESKKIILIFGHL
ncbi:unnamed protein product [Adineta steineri]|uniref:Uncharacterized protein n=1 Tax=Adineta steineri TaxID=433720 RepID=A0A815YJ72_9BILA|nr:unnamed protein product [Adineta steineri]CAF1669165.1 unnamed protein product [Adineta steineri]